MALGPHPILDTLIAWEPENSHVREVFGLGDRELPPGPLTPDAIHDPTPPRVITHARVISATPTGSLTLDMGPGRSVSLDPASVWVSA
jgi:hypothetical protein